MNRENIIKTIKLNRRYKNNEDLLEQFTDTVISRLTDLLPNIKDENIKHRLIEKTISKSIIDVLKAKKRYGTVIKKQKIDYSTINLDTKIHKAPQIPLAKLKQLYSSLKKSDENNDTNYLAIINAIYKENKTLQELSNLMNISENDIVDMLFDMSEYSSKVMQV